MNGQNSKGGSRSYSRRAVDMLDSAWENATAPRVAAAGAAAGAVALGALAYAVMRDKDRRDRLTRTARDYTDRANNWWHGSEKRSASQPAAPMAG